MIKIIEKPEEVMLSFDKDKADEGRKMWVKKSKENIDKMMEGKKAGLHIFIAGNPEVDFDIDTQSLDITPNARMEITMFGRTADALALVLQAKEGIKKAEENLMRKMKGENE